jgi:hypothetical protein
LVPGCVAVVIVQSNVSSPVVPAEMAGPVTSSPPGRTSFHSDAPVKSGTDPQSASRNRACN